ncbi:hypothetical protein ADIMK_0517 [Marinobacterium lacunae]|uniref:Uncharacterized protein n=1 Tax=Marinobacterium lacunae TaxID=1232683 RepID=A0A081G455_9GAMM|nr:hypothetical protein [Marinobacterium lacunae]KEA65560.1 hypothetical protein ADIMK_0517 [Marinobacterium lacunae]
MLDLSGRQLYRCRHCGAFATSPTEGGDEWSFNVHGQVVMPGGDD